MDGCWQGVARSPVDMDWRPADVEASTVEVNGNGHHDGPDIGPKVELVPVNGHNGNGHHDGADKPPLSLFSWAEFMAAEQVKPRRRSRKPQPTSPSLFEWALTLEREREAVLAGAGR